MSPAAITNPTRKRGQQPVAGSALEKDLGGLTLEAVTCGGGSGRPRWRVGLVWGITMTSFRPNEPPMPEALAYFLTWATYGTWLPGDERGWVLYKHGWQLPDPIRKLEAEAKMSEDACILDRAQRDLVEKVIADHCRIR